MLRFASAITTGAGILLVVPTLGGQDRVTTLEGALSETIRSLEMFTDLSERVESDRDAVRALRLFTEEPIADERERDERLFELRQEVNRLQIEFDAVEGGAPGLARAGALPFNLPVRPPQDSPPADMAPPKGGLDVETLAALDNVRVPGAAPSPSTSKEATKVRTTDEPAEAEGYSADPLRQAIACLRAGAYDKGLQLLDELGETPEALFWRGRIYEKLDEQDAAVSAFEAARKADPEGPFAIRASERLEFLTWKRDFTRSLPGRETSTTPQSAGRRAQ